MSDDFKQRLENEYDELHDKIVKLESFLSSGKAVVNNEYMALLNDQLVIMKEYESILVKRLKMVNNG